MGCDTIPIYHIYQSNQFLLTHPVWDVTSRLPLLRQRLLISTHTSRVGCDHVNGFFKQRIVIFLLTHPVWDVTFFTSRLGIIYIFLLTHPVWDVTEPMWLMGFDVPISTHTSRVGCDGSLPEEYIRIPISTHTSRVGCDCDGIFLLDPRLIFLLTHPVWDVTFLITSSSPVSFKNQMIITPSGLYVFFAPICSTLLSQLFPK